MLVKQVQQECPVGSQLLVKYMYLRIYWWLGIWWKS